MGWSDKYKRSIDCNNPKGFSQKAHCQGRKKRNENTMKISEFKEAVRKALQERSINAIGKAQQKNASDIEKALEFYKKNKHTDKKEAFVKVLKKLGDEKKRLQKEMDDAVSSKLRNVGYAGPLESVNEDSYDNNGLRKAFPWANKKELDTIYKWGTAFTRGGAQGIIKKYSKDKDFKPFIKNAAKKFFESVNEGASTEEKRIAMLAVRKQAKYRSVDLATAIRDQIRALEELERDAKRGKLK